MARRGCTLPAAACAPAARWWWCSRLLRGGPQVVSVVAGLAVLLVGAVMPHGRCGCRLVAARSLGRQQRQGLLRRAHRLGWARQLGCGALSVARREMMGPINIPLRARGFSSTRCASGRVDAPGPWPGGGHHDLLAPSECPCRGGGVALPSPCAQQTPLRCRPSWLHVRLLVSRNDSASCLTCSRCAPAVRCSTGEGRNKWGMLERSDPPEAGAPHGCARPHCVACLFQVTYQKRMPGAPVVVHQSYIK